MSHPVLRKVLPGVFASAFGDGMSAVAIAWLALRLAPPGSRGLWVGAAIAAYSLPGVLGTVLLRRWMSGRTGPGLVLANAVLRAVALGTAGALALAGVMSPAGFTALLGVSSLLSAWGSAGKYTLIATVLPAEHRVAGNTVFGVADQVSILAGPPVAGLVAATAGPAVVLVADAASWVLLAVAYARIRGLVPRAARQPGDPGPPDRPIAGQPGDPVAGPPDHPAAGQPSDPVAGQRRSGWLVIRQSRALSGLVGLTFVFYLLYGPVEVALPVHVAVDLRGSAALLGLFWSVFGIGSLAGELAAPFLRRLPSRQVLVAIVLGWGVFLMPLGLNLPAWLALADFAIAGAVWGPWMSLSMGLFQDAVPPQALAEVVAARSSLLLLATPLGTAFGGPLVAGFGARDTMLASALATIMLGVAAAYLVLLRPAAARPVRVGSQN